MTLATNRSLVDVIFIEPLDLVKAQPHQILLSTGSVAIMGQFAGSGGIVHPFVGYCIAVGVEWAYLRGLASDSKAPTIWGAILNWSAFAIVVLWGVLWVAQVTKVMPAHMEGLGGWLLSSAHIVPIAWLSLCSAMTHQAATTQEAKDKTLALVEEQAIERATAEHRRLFDQEQAAEDAKLKRWAEAQRVKQELKHADAAMPVASGKMPRNTLSESMNASSFLCPRCAVQLDRARWMAAKRWGYCKACKTQEVA